MSRKHMPLLIGGAVVLLLAVVLIYLLVSARSRHASGAGDLALVQGKLTRLTSRPVFPSEANVQTMGRQVSIYREYMNGLYDAMRAGQPPAEDVSRARFPLVLEEVIRRLVNDARASSVALPEGFPFGFQRYTEGNLPAEDEATRLVSQLRAIEALCEILFKAGIAELQAVDRTVFEKDLQSAPVEEDYRRGRARDAEAVVAAPSTELYKDPDGLFTRERYGLTFRSSLPAMWAVLDRLAKGNPFVVLTKVEAVNAARPAVLQPKAEESKPEAAKPAAVSAPAGWTAPAAAASGEKKEAEILPRELRVAAGQELPLFRIELDLYRFADAVQAAPEGEVTP